MNQHHPVNDALEELTRAVHALGEALRDAGLVGEGAASGAAAETETTATESVPFVPILVPMDVLRSWGASAPAPTPSVPAPSAPTPSAPPMAPSAAARGPEPVPQNGTWVWTWERPTPEGERIEEEIEGS